jgi:hypothetical protein
MTKINDITRLNKCNPTDSLKWKESVNNDCQQFHLYQQDEHLTSNH